MPTARFKLIKPSLRTATFTSTPMRLLAFKSSPIEPRLSAVLQIANSSRANACEQRRYIAAVAMRGGAGVIALLTAYVLFQVWQRLEGNQKRRILEHMKSVAPELSNFKTGPLWLQRPEKHTFLTDLCNSDPAGPLLVTGPSGCGKSMLLRKALNGRPGVSYLNLRSAPVVSADNLTVSFITLCGYLLPPNELLGRAIFNRGLEQRHYDITEVDRGLRLIKDVLLAEKARGWTARAPDNSLRVVPPLICIDELNYAEVGSNLLEDPVFWRLLDWLLHVSDSRLAHVVLCTSLDTAELLDRYPGFRARRQRVFIDYPRDYTVDSYLRDTVNPFLQSQLGAISRSRIVPVAPMAEASSPPPLAAPVIVSVSSVTEPKPARPRSWLEWWRAAVGATSRTTTGNSNDSENRRIEAPTPSLAKPSSAEVEALLYSASVVKISELSSSSTKQHATVFQSDVFFSTSDEKCHVQQVPADAVSRSSIVAPTVPKVHVPTDSSHVASTSKLETTEKARDLAVASVKMPLMTGSTLPSSADVAAQPLPLPVKVSLPEDDITSLDAATAMPVAAAKAALRAQQQAAALALAHRKQNKEPTRKADGSGLTVAVDLYAADSPPLVNDTTPRVEALGVVDIQPVSSIASATAVVTQSTTPTEASILRLHTTGTISTTAASPNGSSSRPSITPESTTPLSQVTGPPAPSRLLAQTNTDSGPHVAVPPAPRLFVDRKATQTPLSVSGDTFSYPAYASADFVSVDTAAMSSNDGLYGDELYLLEHEEIESIVGTVGGHLQDLLIVVTAVTRGQSWGEALERLVADSAKAVEHMLDDILSADDPTPGSATASSSAARRSHVSSLSRDHEKPLHDYQSNPSPARLAAYGRYVRVWTLLCALSKCKFVSKRELAAKVFPACPHELEFLEATGLFTSINVKAAAKIESTTGFLELQKNHPGIFVTAATPRLRVAFRVVTHDKRLQLQITRISAALRVASLRQKEAELVKHLPEVIAERSYAFQMLQSLVVRDTAIRSSMSSREVKVAPLSSTSSSPETPVDSAALPVRSFESGLLDSADGLGLEVARSRMEALEKEMDDLRKSLSVVRSDIENAMQEASEPSAAAVVSASEWGLVMGSETAAQRTLSGLDALTQSSATFDADVQQAIVGESVETGDQKYVGGSAEHLSSLAPPRYLSAGIPNFDFAALSAPQIEVLKQNWTNPPPPPLPLQPSYYSVAALPNSASAYAGNNTAVAARSPLSPKRRWNQRRDGGKESTVLRVGMRSSPGSAIGGAGVGVESDDELASPTSTPTPKRHSATSDDTDPSSSWHGNTSGSYRWWL